MKYILTSTFLIPTGDDPEKDGSFKPKPIVKKQALPISERGDNFAQLLTEFNSVKDKGTYILAKAKMDEVKSDLSAEQVVEAVKHLTRLEKEFGN